MDTPLKKIVLGWIAAAVVIAAVQPASAVCPLSRSFRSYSGPDTSYIYTDGLCPTGYPCPTGSSVYADFEGTFWQLGLGDPAAGPGADNGTAPAIEGTPALPTGWAPHWQDYPVYLEGNWAGDARIDGCIVNGECMGVLLGDQNPAGTEGFFAALTKDANAVGFDYEFVYNNGSPIFMEPVPRTGINGLGLVSGRVYNATFNGPGTSFLGQYYDPACTQTMIVGYRIYTQVLTSGAAPTQDRDRLNPVWTMRPGGQLANGDPIPLNQGTSIEVDFSVAAGYEFALALVFDSGFETPFLSRSDGVSEPIVTICPPELSCSPLGNSCDIAGASCGPTGAAMISLVRNLSGDPVSSCGPGGFSCPAGQLVATELRQCGACECCSEQPGCLCVGNCSGNVSRQLICVDAQ